MEGGVECWAGHLVYGLGARKCRAFAFFFVEIIGLQQHSVGNFFLGHPVFIGGRGRSWEASRWGRMLGWPSGLWSWGSSVWSICTLIGQAGHGCQDEAESGYLQRQSPSGFLAPAFYVQSSTTTAHAGISGVSVFLHLRTSFVLFTLDCGRP